jgi:GAF domain-containing protein
MSNTDFESPDQYVDSSATLEIKSILCVPILSGDDILGAIYLDSSKPYGFRKEDQRTLNILVGPMAVAIEKDRLISDPNPGNHRTGKSKTNNIVKRIFQF